MTNILYLKMIVGSIVGIGIAALLALYVMPPHSSEVDTIVGALGSGVGSIAPLLREAMK